MVPRRSLMETVEYGYFDDLLIGNFMKTISVNMTLYPYFTPLIAKVGGSAKVYTTANYHRFLKRYFWRNPLGMASYWVEGWTDRSAMPWFKGLADRLGVKAPLKRLYRRILGDPIAQWVHLQQPCTDHVRVDIIRSMRRVSGPPRPRPNSILKWWRQ